ncbi:MAG: C39 family peptidase, partial [Candidatus Magasanikbacteria bacterium]|nr:C39 family peptidase [Candidatus Magasanikbacteria bacterium]
MWPLFLPAETLGATQIPVPFTSQAPFADWRQPWQDACEESTIVMIDAYYAGRTLERMSAREHILHVFRVKEQYYGKSLDENADQIVSMIQKFFSWEAAVVHNPTLEDMQAELDAGRPIILPTYGKGLGNPHFRLGGPVYHTIVISGYDNTTREFITQEPGTMYGLDYRYSYDTLLTAMHDYVPHGKTIEGKKVAIFTNPHATTSLATDGDTDGLTKKQELEAHTHLWHADTDNDGFSDLVEVQHGYSPLVHERNLKNGSLIRTMTHPHIYLLMNGVKQHIVSEEVFLKH